jgi:hypothetical protein
MVLNGAVASASYPRRVASDRSNVLRTPDGRYIVVRGRLWRATDPRLPEAERESWVTALADARQRLRRDGATTPAARAQARADVQAAKVALGERGAVWWDDGAPDWNRHLAKNTPYAAWFVAASSPTDDAIR